MSSFSPFSIKPTCIYVYLRVSTRAQTYKSNGLEEQKEICLDYIKKNYSTLTSSVEFYTDVGSSYNNKNTLSNLNKIIRKISICSNALLLVRDISRLGRDTFQVFNLLRRIKKTNSHIVGIEENLCYNYSRLMDRKFSHSIIDSEECSDVKSIKSRNRINQIKSYGGYIGRVPYGCIVIKKNNIPYIYKNPMEINVIKMIKIVYLKYLNVEKTVKYLNDKNIKYRNGEEWNETKISNHLKKYFPRLRINKKSNLVDEYFSKYQELTEESVEELNEKLTVNCKKTKNDNAKNVNAMGEKLENLNLNQNKNQTQNKNQNKNKNQNEEPKHNNNKKK